MQRADPDQSPVCSDQPSTTPERMSGCGKDRSVEHVFPIPGKFLPGDNPCRQCVAAATFSGHDGAVAGADAQADTEFDRRDVQPPERLHEAKATLLIKRQHMPRYRAATR